MRNKVFLSIGIVFTILLVVVLYKALSGEKLATIDIKMTIPDKHLSIAFGANTDFDNPKLHLVGFYTYIADEKEIRKEIDLRNGMAWNFTGSHFERMRIQNIGGSGSYQIWIKEAKDIVFSTTELVEHFEPVTYSKDKSL